MSLKITTLLALFTLVTQSLARPHHLSPYAHHAVLENDAQEALFPDYYRNPFYKTPRVRNILAHHSWLQYGETPIQNRVADAVPRKEIWKLLSHAGLVSREDFPYA